jgi:hypothetical protein
VALLLLACNSSGDPAPSETPPPPPPDDYAVGQPQNRTGIGDVDRAFIRYEATRGELIDLFKAQPWFQDGLTRDESLFVERSLSFVARYGNPRNEFVGDETIRRKLYLYEKVSLRGKEIELLLIYEPGQPAQRELDLMKAVLPVLEELVGIEYPERVMTVINGGFEINDFNEGQWIRIARCCVLSAFVLAHELAHSYWAMGPSWFNEGMADIYATMALEQLKSNPPPGWNSIPASLDDFHRSRKASVARGRFPDLILSRRFASDGLYEVADVFLLDLRQIIGPSAFAASATEIYGASDFGRIHLREKRIQDIFLRHAADDREEVMALFNRVVWGDNGERYQELQELEGS